jgi:hypothetical protein
MSSGPLALERADRRTDDLLTARRYGLEVPVPASGGPVAVAEADGGVSTT